MVETCSGKLWVDRVSDGTMLGTSLNLDQLETSTGLGMRQD